ncbi:FAD dependent oxidoreductase [Pseudomassariella vexata]|uniref:FAD dependent oxidoreductase n=1 Tax=Pseudomassariella vexata TaxID=1141098 RepID=A0A1Y2E697_9PEZI|nr:FAD dependent oxidoreductase [Pseudomassariella vexata]ORY67042.1 FAD dependent oxidoreductase [Pseudomassariella vexata]
MASDSYIIVGAGVFGTSTAYHLINKHPQAQVTLIDRDAYDAPARVAASWDWNKVVRADYVDIKYCELALEAKEVWAKDALWKPFYHESGVYWISPTNFAQKVADNFKKLGAEFELYVLPVDEARKQFDGLFNDADYTGVKEVLVNKSSGWGAAKDALQKVTKTAVGLGVRYVVAEVTALQFDGAGDCTGITTAKGDSLLASHIILSTGAYTPMLLANSAPDREDLQAGGRMIATGTTEATARLDPSDLTRFAQGPVGISTLPQDRGASNGSLPTVDNCMKFWGQTMYKNTHPHSSGRNISMPPKDPDYAMWHVPELLKEDVRLANTQIFGHMGEGLTFDQYRICWDAVTPSEDFIISPHSACNNLFVATCGSFHGWKFFPILGKYIVQMLEGTLDQELVKKWAWARHLPDTDNNGVWPRKELADLKST